ncbi:agamous-like MADS-box protein AGL29 [Andrographis paniculata]|uniref:agamous-like MADS-box protein AGL29 n=1 Tax=Andrographis paniculata TaxID=175694 RepID=UPI0021E87189|nr:agamous-like MADS-box protein AGL29 [Andrographis paniculata]
MAARQTRGRQRIPIQQIENQSDRYASFSKRRLSLYKKASELSTLCGANMGIIIYSPTGNPYSFFSPNMDVLLRRYRNPTQAPDRMIGYIEDHLRNQIQQQNQQLDEVLEMKEEIKARDKELNKIDPTRVKGWWEHVPIESLGPGEVLEWTAWFETVQAQANQRLEEMRNVVGTSGGATIAIQEEQQVILQQRTIPTPSANPVVPTTYDLLAGPSSSSSQYNVLPQPSSSAQPQQESFPGNENMGNTSSPFYHFSGSFIDEDLFRADNDIAALFGDSHWSFFPLDQNPNNGSGNGDGNSGNNCGGGEGSTL